MQKSVRGYKTEVKEFFAEILYSLGLVVAYEWELVCGVPRRLWLTWFWERRDNEYPDNQ